jgi:glyoxylase-like metal-dependent hydrolase (beta-lactamase superfamily II)
LYDLREAVELLQPESAPTRTSTAIFIFTAPNPGLKTLEGTHTFVVGRRPSVLIDPGPDIPSYVDGLVEWLREEDIEPRAILLSHQHPDHAPGARHLRDVLRVPVWASSRYEETAFEAVEPDFTFGPQQEFPVDEEALRVFETPGHSPDHVAFWLDESGILFSGDTILGRGTSLVAPPEGDMIDYMKTLQHMRTLEPYLIAPGHGPLVNDPLAKIDAYIKHRREREEQILAKLASRPMSVEELVADLYADVDTHLHDLAAGSVAAQLQKLLIEDRVKESAARYELANENYASA